MLNSMYSGISGLGVNQKKLDVIGNNVANSGTTAFKSSSVTFQDNMYQNYRGASAPGRTLGGINPSRVGMGVSIQSITTNMNQGSLNPTGRPYDMAIDGTGYFIVSKGDITGDITVDVNQGMSSASMETFFTRDGSFKVDSHGNLLTTNGYRVMGYAISDGTGTSPKVAVDGKIPCDYVDGNAKDLNANQDKLVPLTIPEVVQKPKFDKDGKPVMGADGKQVIEDVRIQSFSIESDGMIKAVLADGSSAVLGQVAMASFNNNEGLQQIGNNMYTPSGNSGEALVRVGKGVLNGHQDNNKAYGSVCNGYLEMSNVDLSLQFTDMIVATRSFQACSKMITTADEILQDLVNLKR